MNQIGVFNKRIRRYEFFTIPDIPMASDMNPQIYDTHDLQLVSASEDFSKLIEDCMRLKYDVSRLDTIESRPGTFGVMKVTYRIRNNHFRAYMKIAFNCFAKLLEIHGIIDQIYNEAFDEIRNWIRFDSGSVNAHIDHLVDVGFLRVDGRGNRGHVNLCVIDTSVPGKAEVVISILDRQLFRCIVPLSLDDPLHVGHAGLMVDYHSKRLELVPYPLFSSSGLDHSTRTPHVLSVWQIVRR